MIQSLPQNSQIRMTFCIPKRKELETRPITTTSLIPISQFCLNAKAQGEIKQQDLGTLHLALVVIFLLLSPRRLMPSDSTHLYHEICCFVFPSFRGKKEFLFFGDARCKEQESNQGSRP
eukprot:scaffold6371_cov81-Amphora_coffeaeformis.AAC.1